MGLDDLQRRETVDLADRAHELRTEILPDLEERIDEAESADDPEHTPAELRDLRDRLEDQARECEEAVDALGGDGELVFKKLMFDESNKLADDVTEFSLDVDFERQQVSGAPKEGYHKIRTLQLSIVEWPDGVDASDVEHDRELGRTVLKVGKFPDKVGDYLYEFALALNDAGEVDDVGNLSSYGLTTTDS